VPVSAPSTPPPASLDKKPRARAAIAAVPSSPPNGGRLRKPFKVNFRHPVSGRFIQIGAFTAQEAASYRQRIETLRTDLRLGGTTPEYVNRVLRRLQYGETTVERATHEYLCRRDLAKNTRKRMEQFLAHLPAEMRARDLADLLSDVIQPWLDRDLAHLEVSTRELHWWSLRAVVRYATKLGWVGAPPWGIWSPHFRGRVRGKRRESLRTVEEAVTFLAAARDVDEMRRKGLPRGFLQLGCALALLAGLRQQEIVGLNWTDCDRESLTISIERQGSGELPKNRLLGLLRVLPELFELLDAWREELTARRLYDPHGPVFPRMYRPPGTPITRRRKHVLVTSDIREIARRAKLPNPNAWNATSLRDSFATLESIAYGGDLQALRERTRHADLKSLARYLRSRSRGPAAPGFQLPPAPASQLPLMLGDGEKADARPDESRRAP